VRKKIIFRKGSAAGLVPQCRSTAAAEVLIATTFFRVVLGSIVVNRLAILRAVNNVEHHDFLVILLDFVDDDVRESDEFRVCPDLAQDAPCA
jgi:hypothetical protein